MFAYASLQTEVVNPILVNIMRKIIKVNSLVETTNLAFNIGKLLKGGEIIELISDLGGGKTAFVKGLAKGMGSDDEVSSPTFTISRVYKAGNLELHHYDFYRLHHAGVVAAQLAESVNENHVVVAVEWGKIVQGVLPAHRLKITIRSTGENSRTFVMEAHDEKHKKLIENL